MRKYGVELIGTFFLVFTVAASSRSGSVLTPVAVGAVLMVMVYAGGHISGAHYNPAVTLAVWVRGKITGADAAAFWTVQVIGGVLGAVVAWWAVDVPSSVTLTPVTGGGAAFVAETLFTFAIAYVVLNVATSKDHPDNGFYGLAIGFTVAAGAIAVGGISGGAFNPAVAIGASTIGLFSWSAIWVYLVGNLVGGTAAALVFLALNPGDGRSAPSPDQRRGVSTDTSVPEPSAG